MLTPKPNINQLPGNREKDGKKKETEGRRRGIKAWLTFSEMQEQKRCVCVCVCMCVCWFLHVHVSVCQPAHKWGGHEEIIASAHTHQCLSQHLFLFIYSSVSSLNWLVQCSVPAAAGITTYLILREPSAHKGKTSFLWKIRVFVRNMTNETAPLHN